MIGAFFFTGPPIFPYPELREFVHDVTRVSHQVNSKSNVRLLLIDLFSKKTERVKDKALPLHCLDSKSPTAQVEGEGKLLSH